MEIQFTNKINISLKLVGDTTERKNINSEFNNFTNKSSQTFIICIPIKNTGVKIYIRLEILNDK